jgi:hypothetical protein
MISGFNSFDGAVLDAHPGRLALIERGGKTFAGFDDFLFRNISRGREEGLRVFGETFEIWSVRGIGMTFHGCP